jgi:hypothetical protein
MVPITRLQELAALVVAVPIQVEVVLLVLEQLVKEWLAEMVELTTILGLLAVVVAVLVLLLQPQQTLPAVMVVQDFHLLLIQFQLQELAAAVEKVAVLTQAELAAAVLKIMMVQLTQAVEAAVETAAATQIIRPLVAQVSLF